MLILEGPDRCGKTSLARALLTKLPEWGYRHHTKPPVPPFEYFSWVADARATTIVDRLHWSERVYGSVYRDQISLTPHEWRLLELTLMAQRAQVVRLTDDPALIQQRYDEHEMYPAAQVPALIGEYDDLIAGGKAPYLTALPSRSYRLPDLVTSAGTLTSDGLDLAMDECSRVAQLPTLTPAAGIGYAEGGGWALIGEAPSYKVMMDPLYHGPRVPWGRGRAAAWLWQAIDLAGVDWRKGYLTNASVLEGCYLRGWARSLRPQVVITVGQVARDLAVEGGLAQVVPHVHHLRHPGFERRFCYSELGDYAAQFAEALADFNLPLALRSPVNLEGVR